MRRYNWRLGLGFFVSVVLLMGNVVLANRSIYGQIQAQSRVSDTWKVRISLRSLMAQFEASVASGRGYALTRDESFLEDFRRAQGLMADELVRIESLTRDDTLQHENARALTLVVDEQMAFARTNLERRRANRSAQSVDPVVMGQSRKRITRIRSVIENMDEAEESLAAARIRQARYHERQTRITIFGATAAAGLALVATFALIQRTVGDREVREAATRRHNAELEARVEERTQSLREAIEGLHAANRELESFSYTVSHDLRAPLRHVVGFADLLDKKSGALLDDTGRRYLGLIKEAGKRAGLLIDDLLGFSRMGRVDLNQGVVSMQAKVEKVRDELELENPERAIDWQIGELPYVWGDLAMLRLVWRNLLDNAVKYSGKQATPRIEVGCRRTETELEFFVHDNGVGFDMAHADHLFGVFQRLHDTDAFEGSGIGLATVRRIVARHGGRVRAQSAPGEGATFTFTLPIERLRTQDQAEKEKE